PSSLFGAAINENFDPAAIFGQIGQGALMAGAMHFAKPLLNPVLGRLGNAISRRIGPRPTAQILSFPGSREHMDETFAHYQQEKPGATKQHFLRELDEAMLARHQTAFADPQTQHTMRQQLLEGLPEGQHQKLAKAKIEVVGDAEFSRKFG